MSSEHPKRRLATILAADVAGYSTHVARDEEGAIRILHSHRAVIDRLIARHDGRIFNTGGDSVLAEFGSAVEAVRCAMAIQEELRVRNAELIPERQMLYRIGINLGDVFVDGEDLLGDGVNVAARLEVLAEPGGICISGSTLDQVKNKISVGFLNLGDQKLKNIPEPIRAFRIIREPATVRAASVPDGGSSIRLGKRALLLGGLLAAVVLGMLGLWYRLGSSSIGPPKLPARFTTDELTAAQIETLMSGVKIKGNRRIDGQPFTLIMKSDKTVHYEFRQPDAFPDGIRRVIGSWRAEDSRFCFHVRYFHYGREACPRVIKDGEKMWSERRNGERLPWRISLPAAD